VRGAPSFRALCERVGIPKSKRNEILTLTFTPPLRTRRPSCQPELCPEEPHAWQRRFYDFNPWSERKRIEKPRYMHRNPVKRGLLLEPEQVGMKQLSQLRISGRKTGAINQWPKAIMKDRDAA
jgi:hypothetical protein